MRAFLERMQAVRGDPADGAKVVELLSEKAKANLVERSKRYAAASGRPIAVEAMLVPARFSLRFEPQRFQAKRSGPYALVHVTGTMPEQKAEIPCVEEGGLWKLDLALPELPPIEKRPGAE